MTDSRVVLDASLFSHFSHSSPLYAFRESRRNNIRLDVYTHELHMQRSDCGW